MIRKLFVLSLSVFTHLSATNLQEIILEGSLETKRIREDIASEERGKLFAHLHHFLGCPIDEKLLYEIKEVVADYYKQEGYPFVVPKIPEQELSKGKLNIQLLEGTVGKMSYSGNRWFGDKTLARFIHLHSGEKIHQERLLNDLVSLNRNPFHYSEATARSGSQKGTTDLEFTTQDRFPLRFYVGADNMGIDVTGNERYFVGVNYGNVWGIGDLLTYQWTTGPSPHEFNSHYLGYTSYLPNYHTLNFIGGYAKIHPKMKDFSSEGRLIQGSMRYEIPFKPLYGNFISEIEFGVDYKRTNSSLFFSDVTENIPLATKNVNLTQLALSYTLEYKRFSHHEINFNLSAYYSPFAWLPNQSQSDFNSLRAHAKPEYLYGEFLLSDFYSYEYGSVLAILRGQLATGPLLSSEQFGLGGYSTVRGYDERAFDGDNALCFNLEVHSPKFNFSKSKFNNKSKLFFLAFLDYGVAHNYQNELVGIPATTNLISVGPGIRFEIPPYVTARLDYGFQLHELDFPTKQFGKFHFSLIAKL